LKKGEKSTEKEIGKIVDIALDNGSILNEKYWNFSYGRCRVYSDGWLVLKRQVSVT